MSFQDGNSAAPGQKLDLRRLSSNLVVGLITGIVSVVFSISDAAFVFSGPLQPYFYNGFGAFLFGGAITLAVTALFSGLRGVVAQSSDEPLVIVAVMAGTISSASQWGVDDAALLPTIMAAIACSTIIAGICFWLMGRLKLSHFVRFVPYPVIAGFMCSIGWLMTRGALEVISGEEVTLNHLSFLLTDHQTLAEWAVGLSFGVGLWMLSRRAIKVVLLPVYILGAVAVFYGVALMFGYDVEGLRDRGWLLSQTPTEAIWPPLSPADLGLVDWSLVLAQAPTFAVIVLVCVLALLLAASGLELSTRNSLNLDKELEAVGYANLLTGLSCGLTGYHSPALSAMNHRVGAQSRWIGPIAACVCLFVLFFGYKFVSLMPRPIFGGLLLWMGLSMLQEWLLETGRRLVRADLIIVLSILGITATAGFLEGVGAGIVLGVVFFVIEYSRIDVVKFAVSGADFRSNVDRPQDEEVALGRFGQQIHIMRLQGFLFFGTGHRLVKSVEQWVASTGPVPARYLLLDFRSVIGMDSTAVLSFVKLYQLAEEHDLNVGLANLSTESVNLLRGSGITLSSEGAMQVFTDLDRGLQIFEDLLLALLPLEAKSGENRHIIDLLESELGDREAAKTLFDYLEPLELDSGDHLIREGADSEELYFLERGLISVVLEPAGGVPIRLRSLRAGAIVGEIALYLGSKRTASVVADVPSRAWRLDRNALDRLSESDPATASLFHEFIVRHLARRLGDTNRLLSRLVN
ncbi:SulP family inorganic anion transporter [Rhodovibrionaceae bacterium A322]